MGWAEYLGLTALVLAVFLVLARLSQSTVRDDAATSHPPDSAEREPDGDTVETAEVEPGGAKSAEAEPAETEPADAQPATAEPSATEEAPPELGTTRLLVNVAITQGLVGAVLVGGVLVFDVPLTALGITDGPWVGGLPALALGLGFGALLWVGNEAAASVADTVGAAYDERLRGVLAPESAGGWLVLLGLVLPTIAFVEELLFRASIIGGTHAAFGVSPWVLAVLSSVAFALGHGAQGRVGVVVTGVLGFALAAGFVVTGSLLVVVVAHYVVNALEFVVHEFLDFERMLGG